jgi:BirA family biotin operon repressor/biotin-[acetyl-CoA-carboxylase] ligase
LAEATDVSNVIMEDDLTEPAVRSLLRSEWIGQSYRYLESAGSTNDLLKRQVAAGDSASPVSGAVLLTDYQEQGRGRLNRSWEAPAQTSLLFSALFRPDWPAKRMSWLTMLAGLAVAEAIEVETKLPVFLKWPNDVVIRHDGIWRKVCGILLEGYVSPEQRLEHAILGVGINVNIPLAQLPPTVQPATSLLVAAGRPVSRLSLLVDLLQRLERLYEAADRGDSPQQQWNRRLITLGQRVEVGRVGQAIPLLGMAEDTDEWGRLLVRDDDGQLHTVIAADVTLRGAVS